MGRTPAHFKSSGKEPVSRQLLKRFERNSAKNVPNSLITLVCMSSFLPRKDNRCTKSSFFTMAIHPLSRKYGHIRPSLSNTFFIIEISKLKNFGLSETI